MRRNIRGERTLKTVSLEDFTKYMKASLVPAISDDLAKILFSKFLENATSSAIPEMIALIGSSGSGKTTYRKTQLIDHTHYYTHDLDEVLMSLPEYISDYSKYEADFAFTKWLPFAQKIANIMAEYAFSNKLNIIYDRTCGTEASFEFIHKVSKSPYRVNMIGFCASWEVIKERVTNRAKLEQRSVPMNLVFEYRQRVSALWEYFLELSRQTNSTITLVDTSKNDNPRNILISRYGVQIIRDHENYDNFLKSGNDIDVKTTFPRVSEILKEPAISR